MKHKLLLTLAAVAISCSGTFAQDEYTNFIRQVQLPAGVEWDVNVDNEGEQLSPLPINPHGARFELWTVRTGPLTSFLLDTKYVGAYVPIGQVAVRSEDPYELIPRTRADRPFWVDVEVTGLLNGATDPVASKSVNLYRHVQSYGPGGSGIGIDRDQASLLSTASIDENGVQTLEYLVNAVPGGNRAKVRGEERFSLFSLPDYQAPESQLASQFIQIWPVADATVNGITGGDVIKGKAPNITIDLNDLYPDSWTYAQVYQGNPQLDVIGTIVPGSSKVHDTSIPKDEELIITQWDSVFTDDGRWTLEVITETPFGADRLFHVSFDVNRTIKVNGSVTSRD